MTPGAQEILAARMRAKLTDAAIQLILNQLAVARTPPDQIAEVRKLLMEWERPYKARESDLLQRQGYALNFIRNYKKKHNKRLPTLEEVIQHSGLSERHAQAELKGGNGRSNKEAKRQRDSRKLPHFAESADFRARNEQR